MIGNQAAYHTAVTAIEKLIVKSKDQKSTSLKSFIVGLYSADDDNPLRFSGKIGMIQLDFDRDFKLHFLRFYDIQSLHMLFEVELFYGFAENFRKPHKDNFCVFDLFSEGIIGLEFRNKEEAEIFTMKIKSVSPKIEDFKQLMKDRIQKQISEKKEASFFGKIKKKINNLIHEEQHHEESIVLKVEKRKGIALNETGQFDLENAPPEWEDFLTRAGVKKEDLKDKQVMKIVIEETIMHQAKKEAEENPDFDKRHLELIKQDEEMTSSSSGSEFVLPVPPPFSGLDLPPPTNGLSLPPPLPGQGTTNRGSTNRADLLDQIRNNKLKLKPVKVTEKGMEVDISSMNKEERHDLAQHLRMKLQMRKQALNRRKASDDEDSDDDD